MSIVFGSPEAKAILFRDKQEARYAQTDEEEEKELVKGTADDIRSRLRRIDWEIEDLEMRLGNLEEDRSRLEKKLKEIQIVAPKMTIEEWNAWAAGGQKT